MNRLNSLMLLLLLPFYAASQQPFTVKPLEVSVRASDIGRINEETRVAFSVTGLEKEFLRVQSFDFTLTDAQGTDLVKKGEERLKAFEKQGFYTSQPIGWSYYDYDFYNRPDALGARFVTYCVPLEDSHSIRLRGVMKVAVKDSDRTERATLENTAIQPGREYAVAGGAVRFMVKGTMNIGDKQYKNYSVETGLPIAGIEVAGRKPFTGLHVAPDEFYVEEDAEEITLIFELMDTKVIQIPVDLEFSAGL